MFARTRVPVPAIAALVVAVVWLSTSVVPGHAGSPAAIHVVAPGETVWVVAHRHYGREVDTRRAVDAVLDANDLTAATVRPGQRLVLPSL